MSKDSTLNLTYLAGIAILFDGVTGLLTPSYLSPCCALSLPIGLVGTGIGVAQALRSNFNPVIYGSHTLGWIGILCLVLASMLHLITKFERHRNQEYNQQFSTEQAIQIAEGWVIIYSVAGVTLCIFAALVYALPWLMDLAEGSRSDDPAGIEPYLDE